MSRVRQDNIEWRDVNNMSNIRCWGLYPLGRYTGWSSWVQRREMRQRSWYGTTLDGKSIFFLFLPCSPTEERLSTAFGCLLPFGTRDRQKWMDRNGWGSVALDCHRAGAGHPVDPSTRFLPKVFFHFGLRWRKKEEEEESCQEFSSWPVKKKTKPRPTNMVVFPLTESRENPDRPVIAAPVEKPKRPPSWNLSDSASTTEKYRNAADRIG